MTTTITPEQLVAQSGWLRARGVLDDRTSALATAQENFEQAEAELVRFGAKAPTPRGEGSQILDGQAHELAGEASVMRREAQRQAVLDARRADQVER